VTETPESSGSPREEQGAVLRSADFVLSVVDPGNPGFGRLWRRILALAAVIGVALVVIGAVLAYRTSFAQYITAIVEMRWFQRYASAEERLRQVVANDSGVRYAPYAALAASLEAQGRVDEAFGVLSEAVQYFTVDYRAHTKRCRTGIEALQVAEAMESCDRAVELAPDRPFVFERRAWARASLGDLPGAASDIGEALALCNEALRSSRCATLEDWIEQLEEGTNPFAEGARPR
jgi:tetratricopeptide (TPR) repeat protein